MHRRADKPARPSTLELAAAAPPTEGERSRDIEYEPVFTGETTVIDDNGTNKKSYINVAGGLLYCYDPENEKVYINDKGKQYRFKIGAGKNTILLRVVKYHGQYYFFYVILGSPVVTTLQRYDPVADTVTDLGLHDYANTSSGLFLERLSRLEIVNGLLLFGVRRSGDSNGEESNGQLHCIQSDHTVLVSHSGELSSWSKFFQHGQNLIVCDTFYGSEVIYKPLSALGISGGWNSISLPAGYKSLWRMQLVNGEIYGIDEDYDNGAYIIYKLLSDYATWADVGQRILATDYNNPDYTSYGDLKYIGGSLYLFPFRDQDRIFKLVGNTWTRVAHPTEENLELLLDIRITLDGTFKQSGGDTYIAAYVKDKTNNATTGVIIKITAAGVLSVIPPGSQPSGWTTDSAVIDGTLYTARGEDLLIMDDNGAAIKKESTFSGIGSNIYNVYYYCGQVYVNYGSGSIRRANLVTPGAVAAALSKDTPASVFKNILMNGVSGEKIIPLTNVDARGIIDRNDIIASGGDPEDYASVKILALSAASAASQIFIMTSGDLDSALLYIPFDIGNVTIKLDGVDYTLLFDSTGTDPTLTVDGARVELGSKFSLGGTELRFLSRGSIILSNATDKNSFPLRLGRGLYTCYDRTIVYTKETVYNLRDGKTLPNAQGRYKAVAGNILQDLGETVNIVTPVPAWSRVRVSPRLRYVFRLVQLVSNGAATGGVSGSPTDDYMSGFVCTWAESGRPPINL